VFIRFSYKNSWWLHDKLVTAEI